MSSGGKEEYDTIVEKSLLDANTPNGKNGRKGEPKKRKNPIREGLLWATDVNNPNAPSLTETAVIAAHNAEMAIPNVQKITKVGFKVAKKEFKLLMS